MDEATMNRLLWEADDQLRGLRAYGHLSRDADFTHLMAVAKRAILLMERQGLNPGQRGGWSFKWTKAEVEAGSCNYDTKELHFSAPLFAIWRVIDCQDTIIHEVAHALVQDGRQHSQAWRNQYYALGGDHRKVTWGDHGEARIARTPRRQQRNWTTNCTQGHGPWTRVRAPRSGTTYSCPTDHEVLTWHRM